MKGSACSRDTTGEAIAGASMSSHNDAASMTEND
jgi:hypothetical protein